MPRLSHLARFVNNGFKGLSIFLKIANAVDMVEMLYFSRNQFQDSMQIIQIRIVPYSIISEGRPKGYLQ